MDPQKKLLVENYIAAYSAMDVNAMLQGFTDEVVFENYSNDQLDLRLEGKSAFRKQAELACTYFSFRKQTITSWEMLGDKIQIAIKYEAILDMDFPNGLNKGDRLELAGKSIFEFKAIAS